MVRFTNQDSFCYFWFSWTQPWHRLLIFMYFETQAWKAEATHAPCPHSHTLFMQFCPPTHTQITVHTSPASHSRRGWFSCSPPPHRHPFLPSSPHHSHPLFLLPTSFIPPSSSGTVAKEPWWPGSFLIGQKKERKKGSSKGRWEGERG